MRIVRHVIALTVVWSAVTLGCTSSSGHDDEENIDTQTQALPVEPIDPGEPVPQCYPKCTGKACGASDGCGKTCKAGYCL